MIKLSESRVVVGRDIATHAISYRSYKRAVSCENVWSNYLQFLFDLYRAHRLDIAQELLRLASSRVSYT